MVRKNHNTYDIINPQYSNGVNSLEGVGLGEVRAIIINDVIHCIAIV